MRKRNYIGEKNVNRQGLIMEVIESYGSRNVTVKFEDGTIKENVYMCAFKKGNVSNDNYKNPTFKDRTGEENILNCGLKAKIIEYNNALDIIIKVFETGEKIKTDYDSFLKGEIIPLTYKSVLGVGYIGVGRYAPKEYEKYHDMWHSMLNRGYNENFKLKNNTYKDVTVCEEWHNFQNFCAWCDNNYYEIENEKIELDKDILIKGSKIYSPNTCVFAPHRINSLILTSRGTRGELPLGVTYCKDTGKYRSIIRFKGKNIHIGRFNTPEEAFYSYKQKKEELIKEVAEEYKDKIPEKLYKALYDYKVEITD